MNINNGLESKRDINEDQGNWLDRHHLGFLNLIAYVFCIHSGKEIDEISASRKATIADMNGLWPRPWLYSRVLFIFVLSFSMLYACWVVEGKGEYSTLLPGMTIIGTLAFPLSMLIFFFECNKFRSISLLSVLRYFLIGSCVSIVITFIFTFLFNIGLETRVSVPIEIRKALGLWYKTIRPFYWVDSHPAIPMLIAVLFEEFGKTLIIYIFLMHYRQQCYILQGMLIGAAVGAGFAVFESAGYAMAGNTDIIGSILTRGLMSPACHTAWGALIGGGTMLINRGVLKYKFLINPKFSALYLFVCLLHFAWNYLLDTNYTLNHNLQLSVFTWFLLLMLLWAGVLQIRKFKEQNYQPF